MLEAMTVLLPEALDPYAPLLVGAMTGLLILFLGWIVSKWVHRMLIRFSAKRDLDEALGSSSPPLSATRFSRRRSSLPSVRSVSNRQA